MRSRAAEPAVVTDITAILRARVAAMSQSSNGTPPAPSGSNALSHSRHGTSPGPFLARSSSLDTFGGGTVGGGTKEEGKDEEGGGAESVARLSSPLQSPLLARSAVFLRRDGGTIVSSWVPVLLFLTIDRWLHVFDLDAKCERMREVAAFHTLVSASKKGLELSVSSQAALCEETEFDPKM